MVLMARLHRVMVVIEHLHGQILDIEENTQTLRGITLRLVDLMGKLAGWVLVDGNRGRNHN